MKVALQTESIPLATTASNDNGYADGAAAARVSAHYINQEFGPQSIFARGALAANDAVVIDAALAEWLAHPHIHYHFERKLEQYRELRPLYQARGIDDPAAFIADNIVDVTFLGHCTPVHRELVAPLAAAAAALHAGGHKVAVHKLYAFVPRKMAQGSLSNHALGRAVDINEHQNPQVWKPAEIAVIKALTAVDLGAPQSREVLRAAGSDFRDKFHAEWIAAQHAELHRLDALDTKTEAEKLEHHRLCVLVADIVSARDELREAKAGFLNLPDELIDAMEAAGFAWGGEYAHSKDCMHFELK